MSDFVMYKMVYFLNRKSRQGFSNFTHAKQSCENYSYLN